MRLKTNENLKKCQKITGKYRKIREKNNINVGEEIRQLPQKVLKLQLKRYLISIKK